MKSLKITQTIILTTVGLLTLFMTNSIVFDLFGIRETQGNYVLFVVYANMLCGYLYLAAAYFNRKNIHFSAISLAIALFVLIIAYFAFNLYIKNGGLFEPRTSLALKGRMAFTFITLFISIYLIKETT